MSWINKVKPSYFDDGVIPSTPWMEMLVYACCICNYNGSCIATFKKRKRTENQFSCICCGIEVTSAAATRARALLSKLVTRQREQLQPCTTAHSHLHYVGHIQARFPIFFITQQNSEWSSVGKPITCPCWQSSSSPTQECKQT